jgi:hypothetical protein
LKQICNSFSNDDSLSQVVALVFVHSAIAPGELRSFISSVTQKSGMVLIIGAAESKGLNSACGGKLRHLNLQMDDSKRLSPAAAVNFALEAIPEDFQYLWTLSSFLNIENNLRLENILPNTDGMLVRGAALPNLHVFEKGSHPLSSLSAPSIYFSVWSLHHLRKTGWIFTPLFGDHDSICQVGLSSLTTISRICGVSRNDDDENENQVRSPIAYLHEVEGVTLRIKGSCSMDTLASSQR